MTKMVDISEKGKSLRIAMARGEIKLKKNTIIAIKEGRIKKGNVIETAQIAATLAVKNTSNLIPLCHLIPIYSVNVAFNIGEEIIACECEVKTEYSTGVEMESLVGVSVALLTIWDMVKYLEKNDEGQYPETKIGNLKVVFKRKG
jgi:cyclic pyranopterin phosphate synthase